ncbi:MAG: hypothetical protein CMM60_09730 [Rhodospirillaceae bacterium]|jgi:hypothetical protein|nr:hypothetical protein [Rhodospirillaceae bacterium]|tara:strand:- start:3283 stop:4413 length:1131 start_codon:yes stop_codon:yes gene_type:complete
MAVKKQTDISPAADAPPPGPAANGGGKRVLTALAVAAAVALVYGGYWSFLAAQVETGVEQWFAERKSEGLKAGYASLRVGGFPFQLVAVIEAPRLAAPQGLKPWSWKGPALVLKARPWRLTRVRLSAPGRHHFTVTQKGRTVAFTVDAGALWLKLKHRGDGTGRAMLSVREVTLRDASEKAVAGVAAADFIVERPGRADDGGAPPALDFLAEAEGISYPAAPVRGLGRTTARLVVQVSVTGEVDDALGSGQLGPGKFGAEAMVLWRDSGGTLEVKRFALNHGPLALDGDGTLALDVAMRPIGAFSLRVKGFEEALDRLAGAGVIKPHPAALAKTVLKALARKQGVPGSGEFKVPLSLQDGWLYVGPVPLAKLPPIL